MQIRIYYEDTDAGGIVYHSNYLKYCERARSEMFFKKKILPIINNTHFVVRKIECDFIKSARFGDILKVDTKIIEFRSASFLLEQIIKIDANIIFTAKVLLVFAKDGKPKRIDKNTKELLELLFI